MPAFVAHERMLSESCVELGLLWCIYRRDVKERGAGSLEAGDQGKGSGVGPIAVGVSMGGSESSLSSPFVMVLRLHRQP